MHTPTIAQSRPREPRFHARLGKILALAALLAPSALKAATIVHNGDTTDPLNATASWTGGIVPGSTDTAVWNAASAGGSFLLGGNLTWHGLQVTSPSGSVTIGSDGNTLTLGTGGIDMSVATQALTIGSNLTIRAGAQTWNVASGQTLTLASTGNFTRTAGAALSLTGGGTIAASMTGISNTNGIIGPWATVINSGSAANGSTSGVTFATLSGGNLVPYTGATPETNGANAWAGLPSGNELAVNFDITPAGSIPTGGVARNANTVRYIGTGATVPSGVQFTTNGFLNAGTGSFTVGTAVAIGPNNELVLDAGSAPLGITGVISNNGTNPSGVTTTGPFLVTLGGANTYTGPTSVSGSGLSLTGSITNSAITNRSSSFTESTTGAMTGTSTFTTESGVVTINGKNNTYTGATAITGGTYVLAGAVNSTSGISVNGAGATLIFNSATAETPAITVTSGSFFGIGTVGAVTLVSGSQNGIANGNGAGGTGTFTLGSLTFGGTGSLVFNLTSGSTPFAVTGALTTTGANGLVSLSGSGSWANGLNNLISFGSFSGSLSDFTLGALQGLNGRQIASGIQLNGSNIAINVTGDSVVWTGANGTSWFVGITGTVGATPNWALKSSGAPTDFWSADAVEFDDTVRLNNSTITPFTTSIGINSGNVNPSAITFNNSALQYTISSTNSFGINGGGSLVKNGTNTVIISTSNNYTGTTTLNAGTLTLNNGVLNGTAITMGRSTLNLSNTASLVGTPLTIGTGGVLTEDGGSTITGASSLTSQGLVTLSGSNNYSGATTITSGTLRLFNNGFLNGSAITVGAGGVLREGGTSSIIGSSSIVTSGSVNLSGSNSYTGVTAINAGVFNLSGSGVLNGTAITVAPGAQFIQDPTSAIIGASSLTLNGQVSLSSTANTYTGATTIASGTLSIPGTSALAGPMNIATTGGTGVLLITGNSSLTASTLTLGGGTTGAGAVFQSGGNVTISAGAGDGTFSIGGFNQTTVGYGYYSISSGTLTAASVDIGARDTSTVGVMDVSGGTVNITNNVSIARGGGATTAGSGLLNITGGTFTWSGAALTSQFEIGDTGAESVVNVGGGASPALLAQTGTEAAATAGGIDVGRVSTSSTAVINILQNGTIQTSRIGATVADTSIINFNGGTLSASPTNSGATFLANTNIKTINVFSGGGTIDNNGTSITIGNSLVAPAGAGVSSIPLSSGGSGYLGAPFVQITGGGGVGATGYAVMNNGSIQSIIITSPGTGYTSAPTITLLGGGATSAAAIGTPTLNGGNLSGGITLVGSGTTTFTGTNTYTGLTTVLHGTLQLGTSLPSTSGVTVASGAALRAPGFFSANGTLNVAGGTVDMTDNVNETLTVGNISFNSATLDFDLLNNNLSDEIASGGAAIIAGTNVINFNVPTGQNIQPGTYTLLTAASGLGGSGFVLGSFPASTFTFSLGSSTATQEILTISGSAVPTTAYWTGLASASGTDPNNQWGYGVKQNLGKSNWSTTPDGLTDPQQAPGSVTNVIMTASNATGVSGTLTTQLDGGYSTKSLTYNVPASTGIRNVIIDTNGNVLVIGSGGLNVAGSSAAGGQIIDSTGTGGVLLSTSQTWGNNSNSQGLVVEDAIAPLSGGTTTLTITGTGSGGVVLGGSIGNGSGNGTLALVLNQPGITQINGVNSFTGPVTLMSGTVQLGSSAAFNGNPITFSAGSSADLQLNGLGGSGGAVNVGAIATNASNPGSVIIESGTTTGVTDILSVALNGNTTYAGTLRDGTGGVFALSTTGNGVLKLTGDNTYSGGTTVFGTTIQIGAANNIGSLTIPNTILLSSGTLESTGGSYSLGANRTIDPGLNTNGIAVDSGTLTLDGTIANNFDSGSLAKTGAGNLIVNAVDSHAGNWVVTAGNVFLTNTNDSYTGVLYTGTGTVVNVASLSNYGVNSAIGNRALGSETTAADSITAGIGLHIAGGTLQYTGSAAQSTNRQIRLGLGTDSIDASGSVPSATVAFTYSGTNTSLFDSAGARTLNLTGSNTGNNIFNIGLSDQAAGTGATSILKSGAGTWVLSGTNTNTGATTITGGILRMGAVNTLGSGANIGAISAGATLDLNGNSQAIAMFSGTSAGQITNMGTGTAILTVTGTAPGNYTGSLLDNTGRIGLSLNSAGGTLTLSGSVNISGPVTITSGTLGIPNGSATVGFVTLGGSNAMLRVRSVAGATSPFLTTAGLNIGASGTSTILFNFNNLASPTVAMISTGTGSLTIAGPTVLALQNSVNLTGGSAIPLIDYTGSLVGNFGNLSLNIGTGSVPLRSSISLVNDTLNTSVDLAVNSDGPVWTGSVVTGSGTRNWDIDTVGDNSTGTLNWQTLTSGSATTYRQLASGTDTVLFNDLASSSATNVNIVQTVSPNGVTVSSNSNNYTFSGQAGIAGSTTLFKSGSSTLTIANNNTYTGTTTIAGGTLQLGNGVTDGTLASTGAVVDNATLAFNRIGSFNYSGVLSGTGLVTMAGAGTQTMSGSNTFTGQYRINGGTLAAGSTTAFNSGNAVGFGPSSNGTFSVNGLAVTIGSLNGDSTGTVVNSNASTSGTLILSNTGADVFNGTLANGSAGTLSVTKAGTGTQALGGANTYSGPTVVNSGTLQFNSPAAMSTNSSKLTLATGAAIALRGDSSQTFTTASLNPSGGSTTTYDVNQLTSGNTNNVLTLASTANFVVGGNSVNMTFNITGGNGYTLNIAGNAQFSGNNNNGWELVPTSANVLISGNILGVAGNSGQVLTLDGTSSGNAITSVISSTLNVTKSNSSTWTLSGANTYTGTTSVTGGRLVISGSLSGTSSVNVSNGATLNVNGLVNTAAAISVTSARLSGQGTIGSATLSSGTLAPGFSVANTATAGTLTASAITLDSASTFSIRLGVAAAGDADSLNAGSVSLNGAALVLTLGSNYVQQPLGTVYVLINGGASGTGTGNNIFAQGSKINVGGNFFNILYGENATGTGVGSDVDLVVAAVPEPGVVGTTLFGLLMVAIGWKLRRRRILSTLGD